MEKNIVITLRENLYQRDIHSYGRFDIGYSPSGWFIMYGWEVHHAKFLPIALSAYYNRITYRQKFRDVFRRKDRIWKRI
jgi:hypothetical protein